MSTKSITSNFNRSKLGGTNNYALCKLNHNCTETDPDLDPTNGPIDILSDLISRTAGVTFETLYKNIASYPSEIDASNKQYIITKYYLEESKIITVTVDVPDKTRITTTISGDTGYDNPLVKIVTIEPNRKINTVYTM